MEREETEEKESVRKTEKERYEMKYKVGDKVRVRSDLEKNKGYRRMVHIRRYGEDAGGEIVTIRGVEVRLQIGENDLCGQTKCLKVR